MIQNWPIKKAIEGSLSRHELESVAQSLVTGENDRYEALLILGRAGAIQYRKLVEQFLDRHDDPMMARLALQVLCRYWELSTDYRDVLKRFINKVDWDQDDDVRLMAIASAGSLLAKEKDLNLLASLLQIFRDLSERQIVREAAYIALAVAMGKQWDELPPHSRHFDLERDVDHSIIAKADTMLGNSA